MTILTNKMSLKPDADQIHHVSYTNIYEFAPGDIFLYDFDSSGLKQPFIVKQVDLEQNGIITTEDAGLPFQKDRFYRLNVMEETHEKVREQIENFTFD